MTKLFIVEGGKTQVLEKQSFDNEKLLQDILERFPEVIALDDLGVSEPFIVIGREVATPAGYIDVLCIDGEGVLTIVETKLARNSQIRREVIGQVLEYVAQVSKWRAQDVIQIANQYFQSEGAPNEVKNFSLLDVLKNTAEQEELIPSEIYDKIDNNLRKGWIKIVIASDTIPETLRDTVIFINSFSNFDIFVLQVQSFKKGNLQIYASTIFGFTSKQNTGLLTERIHWDEDSFFSAISHLSQKVFNTIKNLLEFSRQYASEIRWGRGKVHGSFSFVAEVGGKRFTVFSVFTYGESGTLSLNFGNMRGIINDDELNTFRNNLNKLPGVQLSEEAVTEGKYPTISISSLLKEEDFDIFKSAVKTLIGI